MKIRQWVTYMDAIGAKLQLANRSLVVAAPFFNHGDCLFDRSTDFEIPQHNHGIGEVSDVDGRLHRPE